MNNSKIIVCVSPAPSNARIIRTAAQSAKERKARLIALYVETPTHAAISDENRRRLDANMALAGQLGARTETIYGEDVPSRIAEFAYMNEADTIILGQSVLPAWKKVFQASLTDRLSSLLPDKTLMIIPDVSARAQEAVKFSQTPERTVWKDVLKAAFFLGVATALGLLFQKAGLQEANIVTLFILCVTLTSVVTSSPAAGILNAAASVIVFNYLFTEPLFYFRVYDPGYLITFAVMFVAAFTTGTVASRLKEYAQQSAKKAFRTQILLDTMRLLGQEDSRGRILEVTGNQLLKLTGREILIYPESGGKLLAGKAISPNTDSLPAAPGEEEYKIASWAQREGKSAGAWTEYFTDARHLFLPIRIHGHSYGVFGVSRDERELNSFAHSICDSIVGECALAMENEYNEHAREEAAVSVKNEQLRTTLLRSISHDLRTPLTSIYGNAGNLLSDENQLDEETKTKIYRDIQGDAYWLTSVVENLLSVTRLENKDPSQNLNRSVELIDDVIDEALLHTDHDLRCRNLVRIRSEKMMFADLDVSMISQVIINLVNNAVKYTPEGSEIRIETSAGEKEVLVSVSDNGPGVREEALPNLFDMFYTGERNTADSRRGLGLGLSVCRSIIEAHGGSIHAENVKPSGLRIWFTLPEKEIDLNGDI